jgi:hypothetical protein
MKPTLLRRTGMTAAAVGLCSTAALVLGSVAYADIIQDTIDDNSGGLSLVAGSSTGKTADIFVNTGVTSGADQVDGCNVSSTSPLVLDLVTPTGVTAEPNPLTITQCNPTHYQVTFTAAANAVSGHVTATIVAPAPAGYFDNKVDIPITVTGGTTTPPGPTNTAPVVTVTGVTDGATYEIGETHTPGCSVVDTEDGNSTPAPTVTDNRDSHGLGTVTVDCTYTDHGGLSDSASAMYTWVDTTKPTISHTVTKSSPDGSNGWYVTDVKVDFTCSDTPGSGIKSCTTDPSGTGANPVSVTFGEGKAQSVTATATDWADNTDTDTVSGINVDKTAPTVSWAGGPTAPLYYGDTITPPTCTAVDSLSGPDGCVVTPQTPDTTVGTHTFTATAKDKAGNQTSDTFNYEVLAWRLTGFYQPVDMNGVWNTVKNGSTVPLKFNVYRGTTELTATSVVKTFTQTQTTCPGGSAVTDAIEELATTGGTALRYDSTGHQFVQNWGTPKKQNTCWVAKVTTQDGSSISANFILK